MSSKTRGVAVSTVGYMSLAISGWMLSMTAAGWYTRAFSTAFMVPLAVILAVIAVLAFVTDRGLDAVVFFGGAAVLGSMATYMGSVTYAHAAEPVSYMAWFACLWALYFCCTWAGSLRSGATRSSFLLGLWATFIVLAIGGWTGVGGWLIAGGYLGLITSVLAFVTSGAEIIHYGAVANPNLEATGTGAGTAHPIAAD